MTRSPLYITSTNQMPPFGSKTPMWIKCGAHRPAQKHAHRRWPGLSGASAQQLSHANIWSERYLKHFAAYAQQDKMYKQYALLLSANKDNEKALGYYENLPLMAILF